MSRTHHTFIDATTLAEETWAYLYRVRDGYKLNFRNREYLGQFEEQDGREYDIMSTKSMRPAKTGCYHLSVAAGDTDISLEYLENMPVMDAVPVCFGTGSCTGQIAKCQEGLAPDCSAAKLVCIDPDN